MLTRKKFREVIFLMLFSQDFFPPKKEENLSFFMEMMKVTKKNVKDAEIYVEKILKEKPSIDALIKKTSENYSFQRISKVELNILRLGIFEMLKDKDIPGKVAISESIRLSRKFSSKDSAKFVNAILDSLYKSDSK